MTNLLNPDSATLRTGTLPFASGELDRSGLRLTRAEFARFLGVSKTAITEWLRAGKITINADGRLDPRQAVSQLLRNSDPARLRAKVLAPLVKDIGILQKRITDLEAALAAADENASFHEEASAELAGQLDALERCLQDERDVLVTLPTYKVIDGIVAWLKRIFEEGNAAAGLVTILECVPGNGLDISQHELDSLSLGAHGLTEEGEGESEITEPTLGEIASLHATATHDDEAH